MVPSTTPPSLQITDLTHEDHIEFVAGFQDEFDLFYASPGASKYGSQKAWVLKNVMGAFRTKFGVTSSGLLDKMDRYFRNHTSRSQKSDARLGTVAPPKTRMVTWEEIMATERKGEIDAEATLIRATEGVNSKSDHLRFHRRAKLKVIGLLTVAEIEQYKKKAKDLTESRKAPLNQTAVVELQPTMGMFVSSLVQSCLGWQAGQLGDAVCFLALAYRGEDQQIHTQFSLASNPTVPQCETAVPEIINLFREHLSSDLKKLANRYIPCLEPQQPQQPQLVVSIDETTPKALRAILTEHILSSWLASSSDKVHRTAENLPWKDLEGHEGRESLLDHPADFLSLKSFFPASIESFDVLRDFATNFTSHGPPLFKSPPPAEAPVTTIAPPSLPKSSTPAPPSPPKSSTPTPPSPTKSSTPTPPSPTKSSTLAPASPLKSSTPAPPSPLKSSAPAPTQSTSPNPILHDVTNTELRHSSSLGPTVSPLPPLIQPTFVPLPLPPLRQPIFAPLPLPLPSFVGPALTPIPPTSTPQHPPFTLTMGSIESLEPDVVSGAGTHTVNEITGGNLKETTPCQKKAVGKPSKRKKVAQPVPSSRNLRIRTQTAQAQSTPAVAGSAPTRKQHTGGRARKSNNK